ncbi:MAG: hypothetical protein U0939_22000 [Pirellulales bacterium]
MVSFSPNFSQAQLVDEFVKRTNLIQDRVRLVSNRHSVGLCLHGRPGTGKTHTVMSTLEEDQEPYVLRNARMSPVGLFNVFREFPEHIIVIDDVSSILKEPMAIQILLAACGGKPNEPRTIYYQTDDREEQIAFGGGVILISNSGLSNNDTVQALASRVTVVHHDIPDQAMEAVLRTKALETTAIPNEEDRLMVLELVVGFARQHGVRLSFRHWYRAVECFRFFQSGKSQSDLKVLIESEIRSSTMLADERPTKRERTEQEVAFVQERLSSQVDTPSILSQLKTKFGLGRSTGYKRIEEAKRRLTQRSEDQGPAQAL